MDKMVIYRWIAELVASNSENIVWAIGGPWVVSQKMKKITLNIEVKAWWTLARHHLCQLLVMMY